jgi:hypothetical protein
MKFLHESKQYHLNPVEVELGRIPRIIRSKKEKFLDNPIVTIICYENLNKGRTLKGIENEEIFRAVVRKTNWRQLQNLCSRPILEEFIFHILQMINNEL